MKTTANDLTKAILSFLKCRGHVAFRNNTTGIFDPAKKIFRRGPKSALGTADVIACLRPNGKYMEIEVKVGKDNLSEHQERHGKAVQAAGGYYYIVRNLDNFGDLCDIIDNIASE